MAEGKFIKPNNLDLLRLVFAAQVMLFHGFHHILHEKIGWLDHIPGVPAFFFISGFLIYAAYTRSPSIFLYSQNRFLRLFPGLVFVTLGGVGVVLLAKGGGFIADNIAVIAGWGLAQTTLGQAYNPSIFRDIGVGVINGSLWTITVEILFYICIPVVVWMERFVRHIVVIITIISASIYCAIELDYLSASLGGHSLREYARLTPVYWGWMFGLGILAFKYRQYVPLKASMAVASVLVCSMLAWLDLQGPLFSAKGNYIGLLYYLPYAYLIYYVSFAFPLVRLKNDISYGVYIWHMPLVNLLLVVGFANAVVNLLLVFALTILFAWFSWKYIEKPALSMKRVSIRAD
ncbi:nodulation protein X [Alcanivorax sp. S71-1-4]|uniref:acyltransferase family protein n=1 Tax=Alcanivorax sp. S71-1-4 TaxID=1177159 RepID=UPI00135AC0BD|nr:acyltransferase [Alcanivorax sp. S71-1-4]KAF0809833.1 nodulation protein X [Alcanivorax sp. S71-1-4]